MTKAIELSIVRIYSNTSRVIGAGFLVSEKHILTCAHVVAFALGISASSNEVPRVELNVDFPRVAPGRYFEARVVFWLPLNPDQSEEDIAVLELKHFFFEAHQAVRMLTSEDLWGHPFRILGFPEGKSNGVWASGIFRGRIANNWVQVEDVKETGYRLEEGFSGAPVWDEKLQGIVGMAVAAEKQRQNTKAAFIIPTNVLIKAWHELREQAIALCPYRGLFAFREEDTKFFFGREELTHKLLTAVKQQQIIALIGPSGSGKSSVVFAGLIPQLRSEEDWLIEIFRPGDRPLYNVATKLVPLLETEMSETQQLVEISNQAQALRQGKLTLRDVTDRILNKHKLRKFLLVVDQLEEIYSLCQDDDERQLFLNRILEAINHTNHLTLVLTLRADFLGCALSYRPLADALQNADVKLGPMNRLELQQAIEEPAHLLGVQIEPHLTERILDAVEGKTGSLPLLEFALALLWNKQKNGQLTHQGYEQIGEVEMALADYAEKEYQQLNQLRQQQAQRVFTQLVHPGEGTEDTRRVAKRTEVGEENWSLVNQLADARLVVTGNQTIERNIPSDSDSISDSIQTEETVEIVHEALIQKWQRLQEWMQSDRAFRTWQERLRAAMRQWKSSQQDTGALLRGFPLDEAKDWLQKRRTYLTPNEREYIEISWKVYEEEEAERQEKEFEIRIISEANQTLEKANQKAKQRIKLGIVALSISLIAAAVASIWANIAIRDLIVAQEGTKLEQAGVSALRQMRSGEIEALLSAVKSGQRLEALLRDGQSLQDYPAASPILALQKILDTIYEQNRFNGAQGELKSVSFSPDGKLIATAGKDGTVRLWSLLGEEKAKLKGHKGGLIGGVNNVSFSPTGKILATAGVDNTVRLWDITGRALGQINQHKSEVNSVDFSPDGSQIVTAGDDGIIMLWDLLQSEPKNIKTIEAHQGGVNQAIFSPDGKKIATAGQDGAARIWDSSGKKIIEIKRNQIKQVFSVSFSPDGQYLATATDDNMSRIWNLAGEEQKKLEGHNGWVTSVNFSPDGKQLVTAADDGTVRVWDWSGQQVAQLQGHRGVVWSATYSPNGKYIVTAGRDETARLWNLADKETIQFNMHQSDVNSVSLSPDGQQIVTADHEGIVRIWDISGQEKGEWKGDFRGPLWGISFSPDGKRVATAGYDRTARIWSLSGQLVAELQGHKGWISSIEYSPMGNLIVTSGADKTARLWKASGELIAVLEGHEAVVYQASFSSDSKLIGTGAWDGTIGLWNLSGDRLKQWQGHEGQIRSISFSPDGQYLVSADSSSLVRLWNISGKQQLEFFSYQSGINSIMFSPNGQYLATAGMDGTLKIWDLQGRQFGEFENKQGAIWSINLSPNGKLIVAGGNKGFLNIWQIKELKQLLFEGCQWLHYYIENQLLTKTFSVDKCN